MLALLIVIKLGRSSIEHSISLNLIVDLPSLDSLEETENDTTEEMGRLIKLG
jgi:hypothetical protein